MATAEVVAGAVKSFQDEGKGKKEDGTTLEPKDFFWDQFLKYISSAILALTVLNVSVEFLRGGGVQCFPPTNIKDIITVEEDELNRGFSIRQSDYFNTYCSQSVPSSEYIPLFILVQSIFLIAPHFIWKAIFKGDFDSFFAVTQKLDRLRDRKTGIYDPTNFDRVEKLELEFGSTKRKIFLSYIFKLILQLLACLGFIIFGETFFVDFSFAFDCPAGFSHTNIPYNWPLNATIPCVYASLRILRLIRYADYILIGISLALVIVGLIWCFIRHTKELGHSNIAHFVFQSCLTAKSYVSPQPYEVRIDIHQTDKCWFCCLPFALLFSNFKGCIWCSVRFMLFAPRIHNDLDFLEMCLFRADSSHGRVFKEILIDKELRKFRGQDHELLHLFLNVQLDMNNLMEDEKEEALRRSQSHVEENDVQPQNDDQPITRNATSLSSSSSTPSPEVSVKIGQPPREKDLHHFFKMGGFTGNPEKYAFTHYQSLLGNTEWRPVEGIRDRLYGFVKFSPKHLEGDAIGEPKTEMAMDISFGSSGYALVLARAFKKVISVNFHPFFRDEKQPVKKEIYYTNYVNVDFPENIFTRSSDTINDAVGQMVGDMFAPKKKPADFIVVGPFTEDSKRVTVTLTIEMLYTSQIIEEGAILLAIRPLKIGHRIMTKRYSKYEPPLQLFDHTFHESTVMPTLKEEVGTDFQIVDGCHGITVQCGDTSCVFEFITYKYIGKTEKHQPPQLRTLADILEEEGEFPNDDFSSPPMIRDLRRSKSSPEPNEYVRKKERYFGGNPSQNRLQQQTSMPARASPNNDQPYAYSSAHRTLQHQHTIGSEPYPSRLSQQSIHSNRFQSDFLSDTSTTIDSNQSSRVAFENVGELGNTISRERGVSLSGVGSWGGGERGIRRRGGMANGSARENRQLNSRVPGRPPNHSSTSAVLSSIEDEEEGDKDLDATTRSPPVFESSEGTQ